MAFIDIIPTSSISDEVRAMYARQEAHWGFVPNYAKVFCHRPEIMGLWAQLQIGIKRHMTKRRFELITFVSATTLRSTLCSLGLVLPVGKSTSGKLVVMRRRKFRTWLLPAVSR